MIKTPQSAAATEKPTTCHIRPGGVVARNRRPDLPECVIGRGGQRDRGRDGDDDEDNGGKWVLIGWL